MNIRTFVSVATAALLVAVLAACSSDLESFGEEALEPTAAATPYTARLVELNASGASGHATLVEKDGEVRVNLDVAGLLDGGVHLQHIHGFAPGTVGVCPTPADDVDGDGLVSLFEGAPVYGPILVTLGTDAAGTFAYSRVFDVAPATPLAEKHIIVHGVDVDGDGDLDGSRDLNGDGEIGGTGNGLFDLTEAAFELTLPALCGDIGPAGRGNR